MTYSTAKLTHGYTNTMIVIDLTSRAVTTPALTPQVRDYFLGGRALGLYLLHRRITPQTTPSSPENPLIFSTLRAVRASLSKSSLCFVR